MDFLQVFYTLIQINSCIVVGSFFKLNVVFTCEFFFVLFHHSTDKFRFVLEDPNDITLGVIILLQDEIKLQGIVLWVQLIQFENSWISLKFYFGAVDV